MVSDSFICRRCGRELRELLVGSRTQPGIVWYINRLNESAYRQSRLSPPPNGQSSKSYDLLANSQAVKLLGSIYATLSSWSDTLSITSDVRSKRDKAVWQARMLSGMIPVLRHNCEHVDGLHADLLLYAKQAWKIINRPDDICCGACVNHVERHGHSVPCNTMLYAEESADKVKCPQCSTEYDVAELRKELKRKVRDMLFTASELLKLMETRLNDRMPTSTFYLMVKDGRIRARSVMVVGGESVGMYTYEDVCAARERANRRRANCDV